jgi:hypothetical protein
MTYLHSEKIVSYTTEPIFFETEDKKVIACTSITITKIDPGLLESVLVKMKTPQAVEQLLEEKKTSIYSDRVQTSSNTTPNWSSPSGSQLFPPSKQEKPISTENIAKTSPVIPQKK